MRDKQVIFDELAKARRTLPRSLVEETWSLAAAVGILLGVLACWLCALFATSF